MGHGACDVFNKQAALQNGRATSDASVIGEQAWRMLKSFGFDPKELRGIGIHVQKLEPASGPDRGALPKGQGTIGFKPAMKKLDRVHYAEPQTAASKEVTSTSDSPKPGPSDLPNFSQIDMDVFNALPPELRGELKVAFEQKRRSESPFLQQPEAGTSKAAAKSILPGAKPPSDKPLFPNRQLPLNTGRIARQLAPRTIFAPMKKLNSMIKYKGVKSMQLTDDDLRNVGIDPDVLAILPKKLRDEQLVRARLLKQHGKLPDVSSQRKIIRPRRISPKNVRRLPNPNARYMQPAVLRRQGPKSGEKLYFTEADDIQNAIEAWVERHKKYPPEQRDIEFFAKFLVQSVDSAVSADSGVEKAIAVMKWWRVLLRRRYKDFENVTDSTKVEGHPEKAIAETWWRVFADVKDRMDNVAKKRFGCKLSLR
jgi:DNA repair protein REV1